MHRAAPERRPARVSRAALAGCLLLAGPALHGHRDPSAPVPSLRALRVDAPLVVDGVLDEPFWRETPVATGFIDVRTRQPASQQTTVRVAYTRVHLYVAVECFDDRVDQIRATERREDRSFTGDDWIEIHFDPPHTHRSKYAFFSNPLGTRADANEGPSGIFNYGWSGEWHLAAKIETNRWVVEMRIPFTIMNYERRDGATWGFNVTRQLRRTDVLSFWSFNPTDMYKPRHFGHLTGLDLADSVFDRNWEITPYASLRRDANGAADTIFQTGLDVGFRLTPSITAALTLNPDFGQVEADTDTIELRDTERFLPERRPFFREGDELLRMPHRMYYSRRFTDIDAGFNTSGRWRGLGFSLLNLQGDVSRDEDYHGNSTVLRVLQDIGQRSSLGYYASGSALERSHAVAGSLDGYFFLSDDWRVRLQAAIAGEALEDAAGETVKDRQDYLGEAALVYERYPWSFDLSYRAITREFDPLLGYIPRRDIFGPSCFGQLYLRADRGLYKELRLGAETQLFENGQSRTTLRDYRVFGRILLFNDVGLRLRQSFEYHAPHDNRRTSAGMSLFTTDLWRSFEFGWAGGVFERTEYNEFTLGKPVKFWERLPIRWDFVVRPEDRPDGTQATVWLHQVVFDLFLAPDMWVKGSLQHRDDATRNISLIYGWRFWGRTWWYIAVNNVNDPRNPADSGNSIFAKVAYTF